MSELAKRAVPNPDPADIAAFLGLNPKDLKTQALLAVCDKYGLDPLRGHVVVLPKSPKPYITRDGLLFVAHRSGQFDGIEVSDPVARDGFWHCRATVYRKDWGRPITYPGRYPVDGMNKQYAVEMAIKCAEAMALRRAFEVTGIAVLEEQHDSGEWGNPPARAPRQETSVPSPRRQIRPVPPDRSTTDSPQTGASRPNSAAVVAAFDHARVPQELRAPVARHMIRDDITSAQDLSDEDLTRLVQLLEAQNPQDIEWVGFLEALAGGDASE